MAADPATTTDATRERDAAWALDAAPVSSLSARAARAREAAGWVTTPDGWASAESVGEELRERFAQEDLRTGSRPRYWRLGAALALIAAVGGAVVTVL